jgi:hypothetical protein
MTEAISNPQQQKLIDEFGRFELNKVEINEVAQYVLIKKLLETKGKDIKSLLPQILLDQLEDDKYDFFSGTTYYTDSSENETPESTNEIINYFTSKKYSENLLKINNKDIASLVSHVRFSRVPKENNKPVFKNATEISFSTHYNKSSLNNILQDAAGCGLSSLKVDVISNTGAYYAYKITMNLFFSNARILAEQEKYRLLLTTPTKDDNKKPVVYSLLFGWANPSVAKENQNTKDLYEENICLLLNLINYELGFQPDGSVTLSLNFIGAAESEIDGLNSDVLIDKFQIDQQTEVLNQEVNNAKKSLEDSLAHFRQTTQSLEKLIAESETKIANGADDSEKKNLEYFKQEITSGNEATQVQALQEQVRKITEEKTSQILNLKYTSFLTKLYDYNIVYQGKAEFETSLKESTIRFSATDVARKQAGAGVGGLGRVGATFTSADVATVSKIIERARKIDEAKQTDLSVAEQELIDAFTDTGYRQFATSGKTLFDETVRQGKDGPPVPYGAVYFNYIFVGDIIGVAASNAYHNLASDPNDKSPEDNFKIVLGTLDLEQTKTTYTQDLQNFVSTTFNMLGNEEKTTITLDIASIPIAYNVFTSWFLKNIVAKNVQTYPFNQFVKEFFQDCVLKVIQSYSSWESKFKTKTFESNSSTTTSIVKAFADESIEVYYTDMPYVLEDVIGSKRIDTSQIKDIFQDEKRRKKISPFVNKDNLKTPVYKYGFIYGKFGSLGRSGNFKDNLANGIFHFYVGSTTGILKDIKFIPMNSPGRKEVQILNEMGTPLDSKFNVIQRYDVNISCFGFQYFKPGQIIFVDTSLLGFGKPAQKDSIARMFTMGGYYLITNVSHDIEGTDFSTSIIAKFLDYGKGA